MARRTTFLPAPSKFASGLTHRDSANGIALYYAIHINRTLRAVPFARTLLSQLPRNVPRNLTRYTVTAEGGWSPPSLPPFLPSGKFSACLTRDSGGTICEVLRVDNAHATTMNGRRDPDVINRGERSSRIARTQPKFQPKRSGGVSASNRSILWRAPATNDFSF